MVWVVVYKREDIKLYLTKDRQYSSLEEAERFETRYQAFSVGRYTSLLQSAGFTWGVEEVSK